jgi:hypothetical protein
MTTPLPPQDPHSPDEMLPGEAELAALYRQLPQHEPSPALDSKVLHAAAQALETDGARAAVPVGRRNASRERDDWVHPKPTALPVPPTKPARKPQPRWLLGLGSAAALVLAAGLAWRMHESPRTEPVQAPADNTAPAQAKATPAASNMPAPPPEPPKQPSPRTMAATSPAPIATESLKAAAAKRTAAAASAPSMQPAAAAAPAPLAQAADAGITSNADAAPAQELDSIRQLFAQGHGDEAQRRLAAFHQAYPQWKLPPELQAKLRQP